MKLLGSLALASMIGLGSLYGANYNVDASHSDIGFKVKHLMISNVKGNFEKFSGSFIMDEKSKKLSALNGTVDVTSIQTQEAKRDAHLKSPDFFDVAKYPTMTMKLVEQKGDKVVVALTIKDVTKNVEMDLEDVSGPIKDPWGFTRMAFELHGKIDRRDFNIMFNKVLETGGFMVGNEVKMDISIEAIQGK